MSPVISNWREWMPRVLLESLLIVLSILLALAVDQWRERQAREERVAAALTAIRSELAENRRLVAEARTYHGVLADTLSSLSRAGAEAPSPGVIPQGMLAPARVIRTAWQTAESTGTAGHLPYETVLQLSRVYERQAEYESLSTALLHTAYTQVAREGAGAFFRGYANWIGVIQDFAGRERVLLEVYDDALEGIAP